METNNAVSTVDKVGQWYFDNMNEMDSTFRICSHCGAVYHIQSGDNEFRCCPNCFIRMVIK